MIEIFKAVMAFSRITSRGCRNVCESNLSRRARAQTPSLIVADAIANRHSLIICRDVFMLNSIINS